jgi:hypothetical protein
MAPVALASYLQEGSRVYAAILQVDSVRGSRPRIIFLSDTVIVFPIMKAQVDTCVGVDWSEVNNPPARLALLIDVDISFEAHARCLNLHMSCPGSLLYSASSPAAVNPIDVTAHHAEYKACICVASVSVGSCSPFSSL